MKHLNVDLMLRSKIYNTNKQKSFSFCLELFLKPWSFLQESRTKQISPPTSHSTRNTQFLFAFWLFFAPLVKQKSLYVARG